MNKNEKKKYKKYTAWRGSWGNVNPVTKIAPDKKKEKKKNQCRQKD